LFRSAFEYNRYGFAAVFCGVEVFGAASGVVFNQQIRRVKYIGGGAVVLLQINNAGVLEIAFKFQNVADVSAAPGINRLVGVAYHAQVAVLLRECFGNDVLRAVGVLILVHQYMLERFLIVFADVGLVAQELHGFKQQVAEIKRACLAQFLFVPQIYVRHRQPERGVGGLRMNGVGLRVHHIVFCARDEV